jgi:hypothetical protein
VGMRIWMCLLLGGALATTWQYCKAEPASSVPLSIRDARPAEGDEFVQALVVQLCQEGTAAGERYRVVIAESEELPRGMAAGGQIDLGLPWVVLRSGDNWTGQAIPAGWRLWVVARVQWPAEGHELARGGSVAVLR